MVTDSQERVSTLVKIPAMFAGGPKSKKKGKAKGLRRKTTVGSDKSLKAKRLRRRTTAAPKKGAKKKGVNLLRLKKNKSKAKKKEVSATSTDAEKEEVSVPPTVTEVEEEEVRASPTDSEKKEANASPRMSTLDMSSHMQNLYGLRHKVVAQDTEIIELRRRQKLIVTSLKRDLAAKDKEIEILKAGSSESSGRKLLMRMQRELAAKDREIQTLKSGNDSSSESDGS